VAPEFGEQALHSPSRENAPGRQQNSQKSSRLRIKFTAETRCFAACVQTGGVRPRNRVSRPGLDRIGPETRQTRPALERTAPVQSDSRPVVGDSEFIWRIADFVRVNPGRGRSTIKFFPGDCRQQTTSMRLLFANRRRCAHIEAGGDEAEASSRAPEARWRCAEAPCRSFAASNRFLKFDFGECKRRPAGTKAGIRGARRGEVECNNFHRCSQPLLLLAVPTLQGKLERQG
jgi:hypothetical protein